MKAEINNENKAKFIAIYTPYGQTWQNQNGNEVPIEDICLNLKNISNLPEDEYQFAYWTVYPTFVRSYPTMVMNFDYTRLKGYAVPWMGLSVEEMTEAGWIKLIE